MTKLNRGNNGIFVNLYKQRAISKGWEDFLQSEAPDREEGDSEAEYNKRKASAMYDLLSSILPDILPRIQQGVNTPYQNWENIKNFGQECKTIRETTIRKTLYNLNLKEPAAFEWWSSKMYSLFSELVVLTGTDIPNAEKVSIILINLGGAFPQLRQGFSTVADLTFESAMETIRVECLTAQTKQGYVHN